jgi:hypothetical protein
MAEPTLQALLDAINALGNDLAKTDAKVDAVRAELGAKVDTVRSELGADVDAVRSELGAKVDAVRSELGAKVDAVNAKVDAHRLETAKGFADLDRELAVMRTPYTARSKRPSLRCERTSTR